MKDSGDSISREALVARIRYHIEKAKFCGLENHEATLLLKEAADAIEELSRENKELSFRAAQLEAMNDALIGETGAADALMVASKPRWIPVTERFPKEGEFVLVYGDLYPNKHDGGVIAVSKRMDWNYWQGFGRERNITHWMPLPEPPKEET